MAEDAPKQPEPLDVHAIHQLVRLMKRYDVTAMDIDEGGNKIRLRRRGPELPSGSYVVNAAPVPQVPQGSPVAAISAPVTPAPPVAPTGVVIESPMVGTFYSSSSPDSAPFVSVGTMIRADSTVCVIEAMKVFTDIPAGHAGTVTEILVKSGQSVEYGQPMFRITPA
jgi:acetyl-CoA carboxylase biotin carboxyl carrier protein